MTHFIGDYCNPERYDYANCLGCPGVHFGKPCECECHPGHEAVRALRAELQGEINKLRGEMDSHVMLSSDDYAKLHKDRTENIRLRDELDDLQHADAIGCASGDCPHDHANECVFALSKELKLVADKARSIVKGYNPRNYR